MSCLNGSKCSDVVVDDGVEHINHFGINIKVAIYKSSDNNFFLQIFAFLYFMGWD